MSKRMEETIDKASTQFTSIIGQLQQTKESEAEKSKKKGELKGPETPEQPADKTPKTVNLTATDINNLIAEFKPSLEKDAKLTGLNYTSAEMLIFTALSKMQGQQYSINEIISKFTIPSPKRSLKI